MQDSTEIIAKYDLKDLVRLRREDPSFEDKCMDYESLWKIMNTVSLEEYSKVLTSFEKSEDRIFLKRRSVIRMIRVHSSHSFAMFLMKEEDMELRNNLLAEAKSIVQGLNGVLTMSSVFQHNIDRNHYLYICGELMIAMEGDITIMLRGGEEEIYDKKYFNAIGEIWTPDLCQRVTNVVDFDDNGFIRLNRDMPISQSAFSNINWNYYFVANRKKVGGSYLAVNYRSKMSEDETEIRKMLDNVEQVITALNNDKHLDWLSNCIHSIKTLYKDVTSQNFKCSSCSFAYRQNQISPAASKSFMVVCPSKMCAGDRCDINLLNVEPNPKNEKFLARKLRKMTKILKIFQQKPPISGVFNTPEIKKKPSTWKLPPLKMQKMLSTWKVNTPENA